MRMARPIGERRDDVRGWLTRSFCVACALSVSIGCRSPAPANRPIESWTPEMGTAQNLASPGRSGKILLALTFSGGGTRAAAFSYGVLRELAATPVRFGGTSRPLAQSWNRTSQPRATSWVLLLPARP